MLVGSSHMHIRNYRRMYRSYMMGSSHSNQLHIHSCRRTCCMYMTARMCRCRYMTDSYRTKVLQCRTIDCLSTLESQCRTIDYLSMSFKL